MSGLPDLLANATPGPWKVAPWSNTQDDLVVVQNARGMDVTVAGGGIVAEEVANMALVALAPEMAALLVDTVKFVRDPKWAGVNNPACSQEALLARFDALGKDTA